MARYAYKPFTGRPLPKAVQLERAARRLRGFCDDYAGALSPELKSDFELLSQWYLDFAKSKSHGGKASKGTPKTKKKT